jgi:hypothetical protein
MKRTVLFLSLRFANGRRLSEVIRITLWIS